MDAPRPCRARSVKNHVQCVTEHEKYAQGATKPGGFAEKGFTGKAGAGGRGSNEVVGDCRC